MGWTLDNIRSAVVGVDRKVPLLDGSPATYVNFDNAASTPALRPVLDAVEELLGWYASVHRGSGFKSLLSTHAFEESRAVVRDFVGADADHDVVLFVKHTTEGVNLAARRLRVEPGGVILTSLMEHHANDLPWRGLAQAAGASVTVEHVRTTPAGRYDLADLEARLRAHRGRVALVAVSAASNVTGYVNPVHQVARMSHEAGAKVLVDCAQVAAHRRIRMLPPDHPEHLDFVAFSAHKMYAPFGAGVLVGPRKVFEQGDPMLVGGGCVKVVSLTRAAWEDPPEKEEAGTPNVVGAVAMASAIRVLDEIGWEGIAAHERKLLDYTYGRMERIPALRFYSERPQADEDRVGAIPFNVEGLPDFLTAAVLAFEGGIGVRAGCFCAHPYMKSLLGVAPEEIERFEEQVIRGSRANVPGAVRASFGIYNTQEEADRFLETLQRISRREYRGRYREDAKIGMYFPEGFRARFDECFRL